MVREQIYSAFFNLLASGLRTLRLTETITINSTRYGVIWASRFVGDVSVTNASTGAPYTKIMSGTPTPGQYLVNKGVYTFSSSDEEVSVNITYDYQGIIKASRRLEGWNDVAQAETPALFVVQGTENNPQPRGLPPKWTFSLEIYLYVKTGNSDEVIASSLLNPLIDEIENMLAPDYAPDAALTLGNTVTSVTMSEVITADGELSDGSIAVIPISILVPR
jgi:hypothetical protein